MGAVPPLGIAAVARGDAAVGAVWIAVLPAIYVIGRVVGRVAARNAPSPLEADEPIGTARLLIRQAAGVGVLSLLFLAAGILTLPDGSLAAALGVFGLWLAVRALQSLVTVRALAELCEREGLGPVVVVVFGRERGARGFLRRHAVIGVDERRLAIARSVFRDPAFEIWPLTEVGRFEVQMKGRLGDLRLAVGDIDLQLTALGARPLGRAEEMVAAVQP